MRKRNKKVVTASEMMQLFEAMDIQAAKILGCKVSDVRDVVVEWIRHHAESSTNDVRVSAKTLRDVKRLLNGIADELNGSSFGVVVVRDIGERLGIPEFRAYYLMGVAAKLGWLTYEGAGRMGTRVTLMPREGVMAATVTADTLIYLSEDEVAKKALEAARNAVRESLAKVEADFKKLLRITEARLLRKLKLDD